MDGLYIGPRLTIHIHMYRRDFFVWSVRMLLSSPIAPPLPSISIRTNRDLFVVVSISYDLQLTYCL